METTVNSLKCISWNVNGLAARMTDLHCFVVSNDIDVVELQETLDRDDVLLPPSLPTISSHSWWGYPRYGCVC